MEAEPPAPPQLSLSWSPVADLHLPCPQSLAQAEAPQSGRLTCRSPSPTAKAVRVPVPGPCPRCQLPRGRRVWATALPGVRLRSPPTPEVPCSTTRSTVTSPLSRARPGVTSEQTVCARTPDLRPALEQTQTSTRTEGRWIRSWRLLAPRPCLHVDSHTTSSALLCAARARRPNHGKGLLLVT